MKKAIILLSGGIDSATCAAIARRKGYRLYALSFNYGQRHSVELKAAEKVASLLNMAEHKTVKIDLRTIGGSSLTASLPVPKHRNLKKRVSKIPSTYVPARNTIFLSYALAWAEVMGIRDIFIGVNSVDYSGYPDCRPAYIKAFQAMAGLATRAGVEGEKVRIHTPLLKLTKAQIIRRGVLLGLDYGLTHSCYDPSPDGAACGACDSCLIRKKGFKDAGVKDPTRYKKQIIS
ncbi:MAG: 7-cyano-7-deazaguanine synthase QueC [Chitinispirillaceae bacterium]|nr:7-cyano-7-deazaguanine synthase QueC [Chitinispirillaceae bacterium]